MKNQSHLLLVFSLFCPPFYPQTVGKKACPPCLAEFNHWTSSRTWKVRTAYPTWLLVCLTALCFGLGGCAALTDSVQEPPVLTLSSAGRTMDGPHPTYTFEIYADGAVHYHGDINVNVIGDRQAKITPEQVQQLITTYKGIDNVFKKYEPLDKYGALIVRDNPFVFRLQYQGEASKISAAGYAKYVFIKLNDMIPFKSWVCFPKDNPMSERIFCPLGWRPIAPSDVDKILNEQLMSPIK